MTKTICIIQARMGSSRLPGKVLKKLNNKTILEHVVERLNSCNELDEIIVATSTLKNDDLIAKLCIEKNINLFRGSEKDVLKRYYEASNKFNGDIIVRVTSDCPLICPKLVDEAISFFKKNQFDYVGPRKPNDINGLIRGFDVEVFSKEALKKAYEQGEDDLSREHVTYHMYSNPNKFKVDIFNFSDEFKDSSIRLCVDEENDYELMKVIYSKLYNGNIIDAKDVLDLLRKNPQIKEINNSVKQKLV